jgi:prepilin-type N-terminal cleavage/methylation domain-containing protein
MRGRSRGFTLVEMLAVMAIIAVLAGLIVSVSSMAQRRSREKAAQATIVRLRLAAEQYQADFGDYPPTSLRELGAISTNGVNEGIESLLRCLTTRRERGPYLQFDEKELANTDGDSISRDPCDSVIESKELFEIVDPWGNPFIYFHNRDYRGGEKIERYEFADGERPRCKPHPSEKTGAFPAPGSFVIWSAGPDGKNDDGEGDDIASWK